LVETAVKETPVRLSSRGICALRFVIAFVSVRGRTVHRSWQVFSLREHVEYVAAFCDGVLHGVFVVLFAQIHLSSEAGVDCFAARSEENFRTPLRNAGFADWP